MAYFQIEDGVCTGRGFADINADGLCAKFKDWIVRTPVMGGPGWHIVADHSSSLEKSFAPAAVDIVNEILTIPNHGFSNCHTVRYSNSGGTVITGLTANTTYYVIFVDENSIKLASNYNNAMAGTALNLSAVGSGTHSLTPLEFFIIVSDTLNPALNAYNSSPSGNAPKYLRVGYLVSNAGYLQVHALLYWDVVNRMGRGYWTGREVATYDAADFVYSFRGGAEQMMIATRTGTTWQHFFIDDFVGDINLLESSSKVGVLQTGVSSGSNVVCQLASGQGVNFTVGNFYFIYDFSVDTKVNYARVTSVDIALNTVTLDTVSTNFPAGAVLSPYAHRFYARGVTRIQLNPSPSVAVDNTYTVSYVSYSRIPYFSTPASNQCIRPQISGIQVQGTVYSDRLISLISTMAPDDTGFYAAQRPILVEHTSVVGASNRAYGVCKNIYVSTPGSALAWADYRIINGKQWLYIGQNDFYQFVLNTESLS